ncbi:MAG: ATP-binding protein [Sedimentisphaerales bacterium]|nr:ATP-binding protein [Sedimentisphaerales bacterium]MBN2842410.1 ATP-binding protein [Sedimentisphaerales bacterium]
MITRDIQSELIQSAKEYPAITILGPRQSGKTTLAQMTFPQLGYCSLEDPDIRYQANKDPRGLLASYPQGLILDEIQRVPELLSYLQGIIDAQPTPGRFILTGSHQPQIHQAISQSLAGRTAVLELLPFSLSELSQYNKKALSTYELIINGFYPRLHDNSLRPGRFYASYMATYIERDVRALINIKDLSQFNAFLRLLAGRIGQLINYSSLANDIGISSTTVKNWVSALKASYIIFELPPYFKNIRKRLVKSPKLYFTDVGLASWLLGLETPQQAQRDPLRGSLYENMLILEAVKQLTNYGSRPLLFFYRDSNGNETDLIISHSRDFTAVEIKSGQTFQPEFTSGIKHFAEILSPDDTLTKMVWYDGQQKTTYQGTTILNPLLHGLNLNAN